MAPALKERNRYAPRPGDPTRVCDPPPPPPFPPSLRCDRAVPCCPFHGITPRPSLCQFASASPAAGQCAPSISCAVVADSCGQHLAQIECLLAGCAFQTDLPYYAPNSIYPRNGNAGSYSVW